MSKLQILGDCLRWISCIAGGLLLLLFVVFLVGERQTIHSLSQKETAMFGFLALMLAGIVIGFWRAVLGCGLVLAGFVGFSALEGALTFRNLFILFPAVALLYALSWIIKRRG